MTISVICYQRQGSVTKISSYPGLHPDLVVPNQTPGDQGGTFFHPSFSKFFLWDWPIWDSVTWYMLGMSSASETKGSWFKPQYRLKINQYRNEPGSFKTFNICKNQFSAMFASK